MVDSALIERDFLNGECGIGNGESKFQKVRRPDRRKVEWAKGKKTRRAWGIAHRDTDRRQKTDDRGQMAEEKTG